VEIARLIAGSHRKFSEMQTFTKMPQVLLNGKVASRPPLEQLEGYQRQPRESEAELGSRGRILVRYSGTENLVRVMVEGEDEAAIHRIAERLLTILVDEIGK
jgi:phosphoglucosamine mutase